MKYALAGTFDRSSGSNLPDQWRSGGRDVMRKVAKEPDNTARSPAQGAARKRRSARDAGFDRWLGKQLHAIYDPVLDEELPEPLRLLIDQFEPRDAPASVAEDGEEEQEASDKRPQKRGGSAGGS